MNFRLIATVGRTSLCGSRYEHIIWMGEFNSLETTFEEAFAEASFCAEQHYGPGFTIRPDEIPTIYH